MPERVTFQTSDKVEIVADHYRSRGEKFAILLHMMPATKESWHDFAAKLIASGYDVLALDERGHGESTMSGKLDYKKFGEKEQQAKMLDVEAAFAFLSRGAGSLPAGRQGRLAGKGEGATEENTIVGGASIGANLAIGFLVAHPGTKLALALSPGLNYRGVTTDGRIKKLHPGQKVVLVASDDDDRDSAESCRELHRLNPEQTVLIEKKGLGHGTTMFEKDSKLMDELLSYLSF